MLCYQDQTFAEAKYAARRATKLPLWVANRRHHHQIEIMASHVELPSLRGHEWRRKVLYGKRIQRHPDRRHDLERLPLRTPPLMGGVPGLLTRKFRTLVSGVQRRVSITNPSWVKSPKVRVMR
jgi:hypothetical protein